MESHDRDLHRLFYEGFKNSHANKPATQRAKRFLLEDTLNQKQRAHRENQAHRVLNNRSLLFIGLMSLLLLSISAFYVQSDLNHQKLDVVKKSASLIEMRMSFEANAMDAYLLQHDFFNQELLSRMNPKVDEIIKKIDYLSGIVTFLSAHHLGTDWVLEQNDKTHLREFSQGKKMLTAYRDHWQKTSLRALSGALDEAKVDYSQHALSVHTELLNYARNEFAARLQIFAERQKHLEHVILKAGFLNAFLIFLASFCFVLEIFKPKKTNPKDQRVATGTDLEFSANQLAEMSKKYAVFRLKLNDLADEFLKFHKECLEQEGQKSSGMEIKEVGEADSVDNVVPSKVA